MGLFKFISGLLQSPRKTPERISWEVFQDMQLKFGLDYEITVLTVSGSSGDVHRLYSNGDVLYRTKLNRAIIVQYSDLTQVLYTPPVNTNDHPS